MDGGPPHPSKQIFYFWVEPWARRARGAQGPWGHGPPEPVRPRVPGAIGPQAREAQVPGAMGPPGPWGPGPWGHGHPGPVGPWVPLR